MIFSGRGAAITACSSQSGHASFSRLVTSTKYFARSTSNRWLSSWPITTVSFPQRQAPHYLLRDRDAIYGGDFAALSQDVGMEEVITAPRCPWQNPYVERLIGSVRRECLDHFIVRNQPSLRWILQSYFAYYQRSRTHLAWAKMRPSPERCNRQTRVVCLQVGELHHRYQRRAA